MNDSKPFNEKFEPELAAVERPASSQISENVQKLRGLLRTNKLAIVLEIAVMFVPLYTLLFISNRLGGDDFFPLGGGLILTGGPLVNLGFLVFVATFWVVAKIRGSAWSDFGLARPKSWVRTILTGIGVTVAILVSFSVFLALIQPAFPNTEETLSRFSFIYGSLPNLILNTVAVWFTAGFLEELMYRGYLMNRLIDLQGKKTKLAWVIALVGSAIIFGLGHTYQGVYGVIKVITVGLMFGASFLALRRNLWSLVIAHALIDTISMVLHYLGN